MVTAPYRAATKLETMRPIENWFFTGMALAMHSRVERAPIRAKVRSAGGYASEALREDRQV
jgi:hypothetical protein